MQLIEEVPQLLPRGFGKKPADLATAVRVSSDMDGKPVDHSYGHRKSVVSPSESEMRDQHPTPDDAGDASFPKFDAENSSMTLSA